MIYHPLIVQKLMMKKGGRASSQKPTFNDIKNNQIAKRRDACQ
jgi:hypothetical protein